MPTKKWCRFSVRVCICCGWHVVLAWGYRCLRRRLNLLLVSVWAGITDDRRQDQCLQTTYWLFPRSVSASMCRLKWQHDRCFHRCRGCCRDRCVVWCARLLPDQCGFWCRGCCRDLSLQQWCASVTTPSWIDLVSASMRLCNYASVLASVYKSNEFIGDGSVSNDHVDVNIQFRWPMTTLNENTGVGFSEYLI